MMLPRSVPDRVGLPIAVDRADDLHATTSFRHRDLRDPRDSCPSCCRARRCGHGLRAAAGPSRRLGPRSRTAPPGRFPEQRAAIGDRILLGGHRELVQKLSITKYWVTPTPRQNPVFKTGLVARTRRIAECRRAAAPPVHCTTSIPSLNAGGRYRARIASRSVRPCRRLPSALPGRKPIVAGPVRRADVSSRSRSPSRGPRPAWRCAPPA